MIRIENAGHSYGSGRWLFRGLSASFPAGRIAAILGPNGCGKTTLLRAIGGTLTLKEGIVEIDGHVGFVPQALTADQSYNAVDMVLLGRSRYLGRFSSPGRTDRDRAYACLEEVGLAALAQQRYDRLSGGQRQLVLLARALASDCKVLVLDEPASALDIANQGVVLRLLVRLASSLGLTVLFTTHHPDHAIGIADTTLLMQRDATHIAGRTEMVLTESNLARMYGVPVRRVDIHAGGETASAIVPLHGLPGKAPDLAPR
ncbi:ABC transporter ATP-binding protein [Bradyrhizobium sp. WBOS7]|uniref:ABC transporter ATP-binding protein n=1 Tax=Bradyrhizobium betae TaxID=244734 RepID=A0AAE9N9V2_9BRAD|nr:MULTISPECIES: ABC transporter ATP-binding protein [Bradyrhizobium]MDD1572140.1 ABC transporter ATP-binding protein [Bradyrhizobium sp. WBOS1]UUO37056.1 ABC transporter ATP-binding protein [Bradyrhizobium sp. WBOS01]MDD1529001.1 ABC transporter ATP-binding protein [Bradyrhizobium sp. WBOS2]MDD1578222.1 ABC transporter ATP-binding protein [Bradyrhizobium sp. WBOS7]MDD1601400.1 ABC transporter ATP-binding protein [Bradyrhizobium sp. WBOS16]